MVKDFQKQLRKSDKYTFEDLLNSVDFNQRLKIIESIKACKINVQESANKENYLPKSNMNDLEKMEKSLKNKILGSMEFISSHTSLNSFRECLKEGKNEICNAPHLKNLGFLLDSILKFSS